MGKSQRDSLAMRFLWISLLALVLAATVQAEECLEKEKVQLGRKKCVCDLCLDMGEKCKGTAKCDKKCSGSGEVEFGGCTFTLTVKKGREKFQNVPVLYPLSQLLDQDLEKLLFQSQGPDLEKLLFQSQGQDLENNLFL